MGGLSPNALLATALDEDLSLACGGITEPKNMKRSLLDQPVLYLIQYPVSHCNQAVA